MYKFNHHLKTVEYEVLVQKWVRLVEGEGSVGSGLLSADVSGAAERSSARQSHPPPLTITRPRKESCLEHRFWEFSGQNIIYIYYNLLQIYLFDTLMFKY